MSSIPACLTRLPTGQIANHYLQLSRLHVAGGWIGVGQALLLGVDVADVADLEKAGDSDALSDETIRRVGYLLTIADGLRDLLCIEECADAWVNQPNAAPIFRGASALSYMLGGRASDLSDVAAYLAAARSGDFS